MEVFFIKNQQRVGAARVPAVLAALSAIGIILGKFLAFNITESMRFSLENITIIFVGIVFGPALGGTVGAVQDLVGCVAVGYAINPIITLGSAAIGVISGLIFKVLKGVKADFRIGISVLTAHAVGSVLIKSFGLSLFYSLPLGATIAWRILNYTVVGAVEIFLLCLLLKSKQILAQINKITSFSINKKFKTGEEISAYAKSVSGVFSKPGLERVEHLLAEIGSPEKELKTVHIAGTNGKGSTSAMLSSILAASGLKVGTFTSPYLIEMREAIRINGEPISESELLGLFERISPIAEAAEDKPTEFELLTAAAYLSFKENAVDVAVIECGMGARRDATNVIESPLLSIITGVAIDHTSFLGSTAAEIAAEKSGVIKYGRPVIVGRADESAMAFIKATADGLCAPIYFPKKPTVKSMTLNGTVFDCDGIEGITISALGEYQPSNAAIAIRAAKLLREYFPNVSDNSIRTGLGAAKWRGRFEIIANDPIVIYDGAHNLDGIKSAVKSIDTYFNGGAIILTGVLQDKEYEAMADEITKVCTEAITITPKSPRALPAEKWALTLSSKAARAEAAPSIEAGVRMAVEKARKSAIPIVCIGSLYSYPDVIKAFGSVLNDN